MVGSLGRERQVFRDTRRRGKGDSSLRRSVMRLHGMVSTMVWLGSHGMLFKTVGQTRKM
ncbi:hypothetical protein DEO72_LG9g1560 [Vigna unguiculata]|uniref:Uncharacterized protein n=1 Tax=Vigna unguiculata TaxID=3917 RepID=A0A4D6N358_VIGUN|nr:hypothetical protein DEO72_LG9g1559 [Vigna unguiculata]QCE06546.1 hypothetical protein DEO72_LG9g1560 [Vigna unguiculata]